jgi:hypothetical protein
VGGDPFEFTGGEVRIRPVTGELDAVPSTRRYDVVLCGFTDVTAVEVDGPGTTGTRHPTGPGPVPGSVTVHLPEVAASTGAVLRLVGDTEPCGTIDVPDRLFTLLDRAQTELVTKEAVHRVVTTHSGLEAVAGLTALDLPRPLFDAVVELLLADAATP